MTNKLKYFAILMINMI